MNSFAELGVSERSLSSLSKLGIETPTEVQSKTIALLLAGTDVIASAQTGSGKTAAYGLPTIERCLGHELAKKRVIRALILVPTRELALQVKSQLEDLSRGTGLRIMAFHGGVGFDYQLRALHQGIDVAVATPGRLNDLIDRGVAKFSALQILVLDEADRMLDMGFTPQVKKIVSALPTQRQTMVFSATLDKRIRELAADYMREPVTVTCGENETIEPSSIEQVSYRMHKWQKDEFLVNMLQKNLHGTVIVFTRTRRTASNVAKRLKSASIHAEEIHSEISQSKRTKTMSRYRAGEFNVLVATDIAARGLDIPSIAHVVNYDLPECASDYVHRIGRTGRAGRAGIAHSFISDDQRHLQREIEKFVGRKFDSAKADSVKTDRAKADSPKTEKCSKLKTNGDTSEAVSYADLFKNIGDKELSEFNPRRSADLKL